MLTTILAFGIPAVAVYLLTGVTRRYALRNAILDRPNERSSHTAPTPRGGGLAVVLALLASTVVLNHLGHLSHGVMVASFGALLVASIGWIDDRGSVSPMVRAVVHVLAAGWALFWIGGMPTLRVGGYVAQLGLFGSVLAITGIVWAINLFNFMDGIDGIAGAEALTLSVTAGALLWWAGSSGLSLLSLATGGAALGFLVWNWAPAKIFMGDVGSGALGYWFALLALSSEREGSVPVLLWGLLAGVFVVDATLTLLRRAARRVPLHVAHRSHAYQRLVESGWGHAQVALGATAVNAGLALLAFAGLRYPTYDMIVVAIGFLVLLALYWLVERRMPMA